MSAHFGVTNLQGLTTPTVGYTNESSSKRSVDIATAEDEVGVTVVAVPKNLVTRDVSIKGKGDAELVNVVAGAFVLGTVRVVSAKQSESADELPDFDITGQAFEDAA